MMHRTERRPISTLRTRHLWGALLLATTATGCAESEGLLRAMPAKTTVKFDFDHRPLPDIPLPNDIATRPDPTSLTGLRLNVSTLASTQNERTVRSLVNTLDGWGVYQPIMIPFTGPLQIESITSRHREDDYDTSNDAIYLIDIDRDSPDFGRIHHLDVGNGNYPVVLERLDRYGENDPRGWTLSLMFEEEDEDKNGNGVLDPGEDTNANGILDRPNYFPGRTPARDDLAGRADALMSFYERATNTLIVAPMVPLRERTTYAVVVTRRIRDIEGQPVGSPFAYVNHAAQTEKLEPLLEVLPPGLHPEEIAFSFAYTTQSITADWIAAREGLYELGPQAHLGEDFPAKVERLFPLKSTGAGEMHEGRVPHLMFHEDWAQALELIIPQLVGGSTTSQQFKALKQGYDFIDFHVMGTYMSPQLFERFDEDGKPLNLNLQSWPPDLYRVPAHTRAEEIPFWLTVPRKEVSVRGEGEMAPVVILGHGYTSTRAELLGYAGFFSQFGVAVLASDNVSHGFGLSPSDIDVFAPVLDNFGLGPAVDALLFARGGMVDDTGDGIPDRWYQDLDRDGTINSGADFWTSYMFHTRDMVRQSALDYMQLIRILRTWDGETLWDIDANGDGIANDLAGDFDGDGQVDIGADSPLYVLGGSLGGMMATTLGSLEPEVDAIIPIAGGGRMTDIGGRSLQGGVPQAVLMRIMGPLYNITLHDDGTARVYTQVVELNRLINVPITTITNVQVGDTMITENLDNGEIRCAYLLPDEADNGVAARARTSLASDLGDATEIRLYRGDALVLGSEECELKDESKPYAIVDQMEAPLREDGTPITLEGLPIAAGELRALMEGFGLRRTNPELRKLMGGFGQMVVDPCDPGVLSRHLAADPFTYPNKGDRTGASFMIVTTVGDMNVPASTGVTIGRAAGVIDYLNPDPRYGKPVNQVLIDTYTSEAVNTLRRHVYVDPPERDSVRGLLGLDHTLGVHVDVENFSQNPNTGEFDDIWGNNIPRLQPGGLNLMMETDMWGNRLRGMSGAIFPYAIPQGQHGFALPGEMTDWALQICRETHGSDAPQCDEQEIVGKVYDVGWFMFHAFGRFLKSGGREYPFFPGCFTRDACSNLPPAPESRPRDTLP
jgi:hypothetical protein